MKLLPLPREKRRLLEPLGRAALTCLLTAGSFGGLCAPLPLAITAAAGPGLPGLCCVLGITFRQAETTLVCRKLYCQDFALDQIPQDVQDIFYRGEPVHRMYIGEVVDIIGNESLANRP